MAKWISLVLVFMALPALAKVDAYDIKMEVSMYGRHVSSPRIVTKAGEPAMIMNKAGLIENFVEVIAVEEEISGKKAIRMKFKVGMTGPDGKRTVISKPEILAFENEEAKISVGSGDKEEFSLSVLAKRVEI